MIPTKYIDVVTDQDPEVRVDQDREPDRGRDRDPILETVKASTTINTILEVTDILPIFDILAVTVIVLGFIMVITSTNPISIHQILRNLTVKSLLGQTLLQIMTRAKSAVEDNVGVIRKEIEDAQDLDRDVVADVSLCVRIKKKKRPLIKR